MMPVSFDLILIYWNDILTVLTFFIAVVVGYHQIKYYRGQSSSIKIDQVTDAEYSDFDNYTRYDFTVRLSTDGRNPVSIPSAELEIDGESINVFTDEVNGRGNRTVGKFRRIRLGSNEYDDFELHAIGGRVATQCPLTANLWLESSDGRVGTEVSFERSI